MKKKALLSSILTIALCLSLIAGSTFALFTDSTSFNIAVTSGDIEISATAKVNGVYSAKGDTTADDKYLVDEFGHTYTHEGPLANDQFTNGGTAAVNQQTGTLEIVNITPGDRVDVDIVVDNTSNVAFVYRYKIVANDTNLATGMVLTVDGDSFEAVKSWTSEWYPVVNPGSTVATKTISLELPVYAGNEYQTEVAEGKTESVEYTITVEAVQGNAVTENESEVVLYPTISAINTAIENGAVINLDGATVDTTDGFVIGAEPVAFVNGTITSTTAGLTLANGTYTLSVGGDAKLVVETTDGACVKVDEATVDLYIESLASFVYNNGARAFEVLNNSTLTFHVADEATKTALEQELTVAGFCNVDATSTVAVVVG